MLDKLKYFKINKKERELILEKIRDCLKKEATIKFAYVFGSFLDAKTFFKDIDIAIYIQPKKQETTLDYQIKLGTQLEELFNFKYPIDLIVLNEAPLSLQHKPVNQGELLFSKDDKILSDFIEDVSLKYIDYKPFREKVFQELVS